LVISYHVTLYVFFFFSSRRRHTRFSRDWSSDVCSSDLRAHARGRAARLEDGPTRHAGGLDRRRRGTGPDGGPRIRTAGRRGRGRSEERRVGEEGRAGGARCRGEKVSRQDVVRGGSIDSN